MGKFTIIPDDYDGVFTGVDNTEVIERYKYPFETIKPEGLIKEKLELFNQFTVKYNNIFWKSFKAFEIPFRSDNELTIRQVERDFYIENLYQSQLFLVWNMFLYNPNIKEDKDNSYDEIMNDLINEQINILFGFFIEAGIYILHYDYFEDDLLLKILFENMTLMDKRDIKKGSIKKTFMEVTIIKMHNKNKGDLKKLCYEFFDKYKDELSDIYPKSSEGIEDPELDVYEKMYKDIHKRQKQYNLFED